jgi:peptidyl-tRNA hydrolase, PTH1 family
MQLIVGLGNPGKEYQNTRHNVGFLALDYFRKEINQDGACTKSKFKAEIYELVLDGNKHLLVYPQTYMNKSGEAVGEIMNFYKLSPADILVMHDEVDLPVGVIKFTESSGSAGHNGIKSMIGNLGTQDFRRIRIGVESRENKTMPPTDTFVLQPFKEEELKQVPFEAIKNRVLLELREKKKVE